MNIDALKLANVIFAVLIVSLVILLLVSVAVGLHNAADQTGKRADTNSLLRVVSTTILESGGNELGSTPVDAWSNPIKVIKAESDTTTVVAAISAGPDLELGTDDDLFWCAYASKAEARSDQ